MSDPVATDPLVASQARSCESTSVPISSRRSSPLKMLHLREMRESDDRRYAPSFVREKQILEFKSEDGFL